MSSLKEVECYLDKNGELDSEQLKIFSRNETSLKEMKVEMELTTVSCVGRDIHSFLHAWNQSYQAIMATDGNNTVANRKRFMPVLEQAYTVVMKDSSFADCLLNVFKLHVAKLQKEIDLYLSSKKRTDRSLRAERIILMLLSRAYSISSLVLESDPQNKGVTIVCYFSPKDAEEGTFTSSSVIIFSRSHNNMCHRLRHKEQHVIPLGDILIKNKNCFSHQKSGQVAQRAVAQQSDFGSLHYYNRMIPPFIDTFLDTCQVTTEYTPVSTLFDQYCSFILSTKQMTNGLAAFVKRRKSFERYVADIAASVLSKGRLVATRHKRKPTDSVSASCSSVPDTCEEKMNVEAINIPPNMMLLNGRQLPETGCSAYNISLTTRPYGVKQHRRFTDPVCFFDSFLLDDGSRRQNTDVPVARIFHSKSKGFCAVAKRDIQKGEIICEYSGSLVGMGEFLDREAVYKLDPHKYPDAEYDGIEDGKVWDPYTVVEGSEVRSITINENTGAWLNSRNKQSSSCSKAKLLHRDLDHNTPNCKVALCVHRGIKRLYVRTLSDIPRSYEMIQDYNCYWWP